MDTSEGWKVVIISVQAELAYICRDQNIIMPRLICIYLQLRVYCNLFVHRSNLPSVVVPYCSCCLCLYFGSSIMLVTYFVNFR